MPRRQLDQFDRDYPLRIALDRAAPRPSLDAPRDHKKNYAQRLSNGLALLLAAALRRHFAGALPTLSGAGQESPVGGDRGKKRLDVKVWDDLLGLMLAISIKTLTFRDWKTKEQQAGRYTKNVVRNDHELRAEAAVVHRRQPYSVMIAILFMPWDACDDAGVRQSDTSSFAHAVQTLRKRAGRQHAVNSYDLFEKVYIGLFELEGPDRGAVRFFDVSQAPPRVGRPRLAALQSFGELIDEIKRVVDDRNERAPIWDDSRDEEDGVG